MRIGFKLFVSPGDHLPQERQGSRIELDVADGTTVAALIARYHIPELSAHLVLVNGVFVPPAERPARALVEGDELAIWPPVADG